MSLVTVSGHEPLGPCALIEEAHAQTPWSHDLPRPVADFTPPFPKPASTSLAGAGPLGLSWGDWQAARRAEAATTMEATAEPVLYQKLLLWEESLEPEKEEEEISEPLIIEPWKPQDSSG